MANGKTFMDVSVPEDWSGPSRVVRVRIFDVARYYQTEARSMSGCRTLAGIVGDWRPVDRVARVCLEHFKQVNVKALRREARKAGLIPKF
jgi:hypothetical protein